MRKIVLMILSVLLVSWQVVPMSAMADEHAPILWPMQPGETLRELATLIYPKNKAMRARMISAAIEMNSDKLPGISADEPFAGGEEVLLPHPYTLSAYARPEPRRHAAPAKPAAMPEATTAPAAGPSSMKHEEDPEEYRQLVQRYEERKQKLQTLDQRLSDLEQKSTELHKAIKENGETLGQQ